MMKKFLIILLVIFALGICAVFIARAVFISGAQTRALDVVHSASVTDDSISDDERVKRLTRAVFNRFKDAERTNASPLHTLRPYISNDRLPKFTRIPDGAVELYVTQGWCDNAARMLKFILSEEGYPSNMFSMATDVAGHAALLVDMPDGRQVLADPYYGVMLERDGVLLHPKNAGADDIATLSAEESKLSFYKRLNTMFMGKYGAHMDIVADIPVLSAGGIQLGALDGRHTDVKRDAIKAKLSPYWYYMGHAHDRGWVRHLRAGAQAVRVEMELIDAPYDGVITSNISPQINGKVLSWDLAPNETLVFEDGRAKINWRTLKSTIFVDQIRFIPLNQSS